MKITPGSPAHPRWLRLPRGCDDNAICQARKPNWDLLWQTLSAHPDRRLRKCVSACRRQQMGNSEVGHLNIGAGRVVYQDFTASSTPSKPASSPPIRAAQSAIETGKQQQRAAHSRPAVAGRRAQPRIADSRHAGNGRRGRRRRTSTCMPFSTAATRRRRSAARFAARAAGKMRRAQRRRASPRSSAATTRWTATSAGSACSRPTT